MSEKTDRSIQKELEDTIVKALVDDELPCAVAFKIAAEKQVNVAQIGQIADEKGIRLSKCQLGLFGYSPAKKIVEPLAPDSPQIQQALIEAKHDNVISCQTVWEIAARFEIPKLNLAHNCEFLAIKIKPCQLGAF